MCVFVSEWLNDKQNDVWNLSIASNSDMMEAIYSLIEEWKSNKEVKLLLNSFKNDHVLIFNNC